MLSKRLQILLYKTSLVDILVTPNHSMKYFSSLLLCSFVNGDEKLKILMSLPDNLSFIQRPGLINILPHAWKRFFGGNDKDINTNVSSNNNNRLKNIYYVDGYNNSDNRNIINVDNCINNSSTDSNDNNLSCFNLHDIVESNSISAAPIELDDNNGNNFDEIVNNIIGSRINMIKDTIHNNIYSSIMLMVTKLLLAEGVNDSTLISSFGVSLTGLCYVTNIIQQNKSFKNHFNLLIGNYISFILSAITLGTGTSICFRNRSNLYLIVSSYNRCQKFIGKYLNRISMIMIISITLVSSLAIKLKVKFAHLKWLYRIVLRKLLESIRVVEQNINASLQRLSEK